MINDIEIFLLNISNFSSTKETFLFNCRTCPSLRYLSVAKCSTITDISLTLFLLSGLCELAKLGPSLRYLSVAKCSTITANPLTLLFTIRSLWAGQAGSVSPLPVRGQMFHHHRQSTNIIFTIRTLWAGQAGSVSPLPVSGQMFHHHRQSTNIIFTIRTLWAGQAGSVSPLPVRGQMFHHHGQRTEARPPLIKTIPN